MANEKGQEQIHGDSALYNKEIAKLFAIIGHELKTPLHNIKAFSSLIDEDFDDYSKDELLQFNQRILQAADMLSRLLENLLTWGQIQIKSIEISGKSVFVHPLIEKSFKLFKYNASNKGVRLINDLDTDLKVYSDKIMLDTVLRNLVGNALKFTPKGGSILISSSTEGNDAIIAVQDTGTGIPKEKLNKLFQTDRLNPERGTEGETGTGLGLLICKDFVEKNNGTIQVESEPGKGSTFYITIPIRRNTDPTDDLD